MKNYTPILNLKISHGKLTIIFLAAICCLSFQTIPAQQTPLPSPKPKINVPIPKPPKEVKKIIVNEGDTPAEKSIATDSKVSITLCVREGNVRVNGWIREEVRVLVENGSQVGFKVVEKNESGKPAWINVLGFDPQKTKEVNSENCLSGTDIELDVPRGASISVRSHESEIKIESVATVLVANLSGDIFLNDISDGIEAATFRGDLMIEKSNGKIVLNNTEGNILALDVAPGKIGDNFKARTSSGRITLKSVKHRQIETTSASGSTSFDGELLSGGQYGFSTTNGSIVLTVSPDSSCKINALFGFGAFASEIPLQNALKKERSLSAQMGKADAECSLNLTSGSGVMRIRKRQ